MTLRIVDVGPETAEAWREVHNLVIPPHQLSTSEVRERLTRHRLTLAYVGETLVGNATVRPGRLPIATVIVRILPAHRRHGYGSAYLDALLASARRLGAQRIETVVLEANAEGLAFAVGRGFVEFDRYEAVGATWIELARIP
jgi:GNAT superfamily N-acetyltransferase